MIHRNLENIEMRLSLVWSRVEGIAIITHPLDWFSALYTKWTDSLHPSIGLIQCVMHLMDWFIVLYTLKIPIRNPASNKYAHKIQHHHNQFTQSRTSASGLDYWVLPAIFSGLDASLHVRSAEVLPRLEWHRQVLVTPSHELGGEGKERLRLSGEWIWPTSWSVEDRSPKCDARINVDDREAVCSYRDLDFFQSSVI